MHKKIIQFAFVFLFSFFANTHFVFAQISSGSFGYYLDAMRFSRTTFGGSARFQGLAGAQTAVGADIGSLNGNPAGLGLFTKSEFTFTPAVGFANTNATYQSITDETQTQDSKVTGNLNNFGIIIFAGKEDVIPGKWRGGSFGISLSRINNFQNQYSYIGNNRFSSKTDFWVEQTNGIRAGDLENLDLLQYELQRRAYFTFLVNPFDYLPDGNSDPNNTDYFTFARDNNGEIFSEIEQRETFNTSGAQYQWTFAGGGNYDDKLYFGGSISLTNLNFRQKRNYQENFSDAFPELISYTEEDDLRVRGTGVSFSAGLIFRPNNFARLGVSVQSPTFYNLKEDFSTEFSSILVNLNGGTDSYNEITEPGEFSYRLTTPWRLNIGAAFFVGKHGFITADAEYVTYPTMRLKNTDEPTLFDADNRTIQNIYLPSWNLRLAGEGRFDIFRARGGVALQTDPFDDLDDVDRKILSFTGGIGIRTAEWYADVAVVHTRFKSAFQSYSFDAFSPYAGTEPTINIQNNFTQGLLTIGFYF